MNTVPVRRLSRRLRALSPRRQARRGQSLVEFVLIVPIMLLLIGVAVDLGRLFYLYVAVENAAKEGALIGSRSPLCVDVGASGCNNPNNVRWHVENEAPNLVDAGGNSIMSASVACRRPNGSLVQPINDCLDGDTYQVEVSAPFRMVTPLISSIVPSDVTLTKRSEATVVIDAFDPSGLETVVWVNTSPAADAGTITSACTPADSVFSPGFFFQPCQDLNNVNNYLTFDEGATVTYKMRVRNTGNINLTAITYTFSENGTTFARPAACSTLPSALVASSAPVSCTFTRPAIVTDPAGGINDDTVSITTTSVAGGLAAGSGAAGSTVHVAPRPRFTVDLKAAPFRLGGDDGYGDAGEPEYATGALTLRRDPAATAGEVREPTGWLQLTVRNGGGPAANFGVSVTRSGSPISLPASCAVPASLGEAGASDDRFTCIFPATFTDTQAYPFTAGASATNSITVGGQQSVTITTDTCNGANKVVPNMVDTLTPTADGSNKTVGQARTVYTDALFTGSVTTVPAGQPDATTVERQGETAYTCEPASTSISVTAP